MHSLYVESSCVLAWLFGEPNANKYVAAIDSAQNVITSTLTIMEVERGLQRALNRGRITAREQLTSLGQFRTSVAEWITIEISKSVRESVGKSFPHEPVRTLDAIHLATALMLVSAFPDLRVLSADHRVAVNAQALGLVVA